MLLTAAIGPSMSAHGCASSDCWGSCIRDRVHSDDQGWGRQLLIRQFTTFALVGAIGTLGHYATLILLVQLFNAHPVIASTAGFLVGAQVNYLLNYHVTFRSSAKHSSTMWKFFFVAGVGVLINGVIMWLCVEKLGIQYLIAQIGATGVLLLWNFGVNKAWTFAGSLNE